MTAAGILHDALGNSVLQGVYTSPAYSVNFTYPGPNSTTSTYTLTFVLKNTYATFGCAGLTVPPHSNQFLLSGVTFPDLSTMAFTYENVYNDSTKSTGRIASVRLR